MDFEIWDGNRGVLGWALGEKGYQRPISACEYVVIASH